MMDDIRRFLEEDVGSGDVTAELLVPDAMGTAAVTCEDDAVLAGLEEACEVFRALGAECRPLNRDGDAVTAGTVVMSVHGSMRALITGERLALNLLMRMSGIPTKTASAIRVMRTKDPEMTIAGTRKTTPGFRRYEKKAIALGGGWPHRMGLYDMILVKDNHLVACGGIGKALELLKQAAPGMPIDVEVTSAEQGMAVADHGVDIILADHMPPEEVRRLRDYARSVSPGTRIEISGNMTEENILGYAGCADIVSMGSLTHSVRAVHFSMDLDPVND
ncbi:MAG: carboxylating nicotinate-nucleotide diphosphorylase [Euryarchaeota archaeon]|nr:carboxylating nicotinate-nucleotide diphosphorylase [Euryarchaeota archaeon]